MVWRCPKCRERLVEEGGRLFCELCRLGYETVAGIPDLRLPGPSWIDYEADRAQARRLAAETSRFNVDELVRHVYSLRDGWNEAKIALRTRQVMAVPQRLQRDVKGWLKAATNGAGPFLDLGCGLGMLLAAVAADGRKGIGIDISMVWLVVAQRLIAEGGGWLLLAAARGEELPLADGSVSGVVSLDVIEYVADPGRYLSEISRITKPGGHIALSTPNRYSLAAEPHVSVWGVGWLPRSVQKAYVNWWSGRPYEFTRLLSTREAAQLLHRYTSFRFRIPIPLVPAEEIAHFLAYRAILARLYNRLALLNWMRWLFLRIGPFFRIVGKKV